jgi:hypothetical protein
MAEAPVSSYWWVDRCLPGAVASAITGALVWASHLLLRRHINAVTERQDRHIEKLTADQTRELRGGSAGGAA